MQLGRLHTQLELADQVKGVVAGQARQIEILRKDQHGENQQGQRHPTGRQHLSVETAHHLGRTRQLAQVSGVPAADAGEHQHGQQGGKGEPGHTALPARQDDPRRQQRAERGTEVATDLENGLRQSVLAARGHAGDPRGLGMKHRRAHADQGRGQQQCRQLAGHRQQDQPAERAGHTHRQRIGLGPPVGIQADDRLQQRCRDLVGQRDQADLAETQVMTAFEHRIQREDQRLHHVVQQMGKTDGEQNREYGAFRSAGCGQCGGLALCVHESLRFENDFHSTPSPDRKDANIYRQTDILPAQKKAARRPLCRSIPLSAT